MWQTSSPKGAGTAPASRRTRGTWRFRLFCGSAGSRLEQTARRKLGAALLRAPQRVIPPAPEPPSQPPRLRPSPFVFSCHVSGPSRGRGPFYPSESSAPLTDAPLRWWSVIWAWRPLAASLGHASPWRCAPSMLPRHQLRQTREGAAFGAFPEPCAAVSGGDGPNLFPLAALRPSTRLAQKLRSIVDEGTAVNWSADGTTFYVNDVDR